MKPKHLHAAIIMLSLLVVGTQPVLGTKYITDDETGGDATSIGIWDWPTKTCTLTTDLAEGIQINSDGITLDGDGHTITKLFTTGVHIHGRKDVTVRNLNVQNFYYGISLVFSSNCTLANNTINSSGLHGISIVYASNNTLTDNMISNAEVYIAHNSSNNILTGNMISNVRVGMELIHNSNNNTLTANTFELNRYGIQFYNSNMNLIYNNNFIDNEVHVSHWASSGNVFNLSTPEGGNYWSDWTKPDKNRDGFVDNPYIISRGTRDNLPWTVPNGWDLIVVREMLQLLIEQVMTLNLPKGFVGKLNEAEKVLSDANPGNNSVACIKMNDFINQVSQNVDKISDAGGNPAALIAEAEAIIAMLETG